MGTAKGSSTLGPAQANQSWHAVEIRQAAELLGVELTTGLNSSEIQDRLSRYGPNTIREMPPRGLVLLLFDQFTNFLIIILLCAAAVSAVIGDAKDMIAIVLIVTLNAIIGFIQDFRAQRAIQALKRLAAANAHVLRKGVRSTIPAANLTPGDIAFVEAGDLVPADLRLFEAEHLRIDESLLTGESSPVDKQTATILDPDVPITDRSNIAFRGTTVVSGRGRGLTVATGMATEVGTIATLLDTGIDTATPLQIRLQRFSRHLGMIVLAICIGIFLLGIARGEPLGLMFLTGMSLAVAAIPEALPAVITISLSLGARKLVEHNALVRHLPAVESLGSVTYICADKTGTLTRNEMRVSELYADGTSIRKFDRIPQSGFWSTLIQAMAVSNDASPGADGRFVGDPTEVALAEAAAELGQPKSVAETAMPRIAELPFDPERKLMTTLHQRGSGARSIVKGAPERVLGICDRMIMLDGVMPLNRGAVLAAAERMATAGQRVIAFGLRDFDALGGSIAMDDMESAFDFIGLIGLLDPPRPEARPAVGNCISAGITPVMITGDHPATGEAIAREIGLMEPGSLIVTGPELDQMNDSDLANKVDRVSIYARVDPRQKIRIVEALQNRGEFVAMTGDGVNDAPALNRANIGIAMGRGGTDVAREASGLILIDDNFATIVAAIREGRRIYDNIRKFIKYTMTSNSAEIGTILFAPLFGLPLPLLPIHILWINLVTDGLPGLALAVEPEDEDVMRRPARPPHESIFACGMWQHMLWCGVVMATVALFAQAWAIRSGSANWQTMVFTILTLSQMGHVLAIRSERQSLFSQGVLSNPQLLGATGLTLVLQIGIIYLPAANTVFKTAPLTLGELGLCIALSSIVFFLVEVEKLLLRTGYLRW